MPEAMNEISPAAIHLAKVGVTREAAIHGAEVATRADAPLIEGRPLTSVVVTQCNLVVAVYMTMPDGKLLRFDKRTDVPAEDLVAVAYTASSSERVEVACEGVGVSGYETHKPI